MGEKCTSCNLSIVLRHIFAISLFVLFGCTASAQVDTLAGDSTAATSLYDYRNARVQFFTGEVLGAWEDIDTTLNGFYQFNPARRNSVFEPVWLGNLGSPVIQRFFTFQRPLGFDYGRHERDAYIVELDEVRYWRTNVPFTNVGYVAGQNLEQYFYVTHTRNFGPQWNAAINFNKIVSEGYYQHAGTDYGNTSLSVWYHSKDERYSIYFAGVRGKSKHDENGGINNDTLFDYPNPELAEPFRDEAFSAWDNWQGRITQQYVFGRNKSYMKDDTTQVTFFAPSFQVSHAVSATEHYYLFEDAGDDQSFYGELNYEMDTLRDRTQVRGVVNALNINNFMPQVDSLNRSAITQFKWQLEARHQLFTVSDQAGISEYQHFLLHASAGATSFKKLYLFAYANYDLLQKNYAGSVLLRTYSNAYNPRLKISYAALSPTIMDIRYTGFARAWDYGYDDQTKILRIHGSLTNYSNGFGLHAQYMHLENYFYTTTTYAWDPGDEPKVVPASTTFGLTQLWMQHKLTPGPFVLENAIGGQFTPDALQLPGLLVNTAWYYKGSLFKKALHTQMGVHAWWCSSYGVLPYDLITGRFLYFSGGNFGAPTPEETTFAPVLDVFVSADVRTLRFFLKMENVAQGLFNKGFYQAPHYPMQPRSFKLGIDWNLYY